MTAVTIAGVIFALAATAGRDGADLPGRGNAPHSTGSLIAAAASPGTTSAIALSRTPISFEPVDRQRTRDVIASFHVMPRQARASETPRITTTSDAVLDLQPGDRSIDMTAGEYRPARRREPGAVADARLSMRLDGARRNDPDFGVGGIGGALMRMTSALID